MTGNATELSKSERKRQAHVLQNLGKRLTELNADDLDSLPLPLELKDAIADYRRFGSFEAKRRQLQFIGKLMRDIEVEPIQNLLDRLDGTSAAARYELHELERWRERLLADPKALTDYLKAYPHADRQRLRQHLKRARQAGDERAAKTASRALFRLLREIAYEA